MNNALIYNEGCISQERDEGKRAIIYVHGGTNSGISMTSAVLARG